MRYRQPNPIKEGNPSDTVRCESGSDECRISLEEMQKRRRGDIAKKPLGGIPPRGIFLVAFGTSYVAGGSFF